MISLLLPQSAGRKLSSTLPGAAFVGGLFSRVVLQPLVGRTGS